MERKAALLLTLLFASAAVSVTQARNSTSTSTTEHVDLHPTTEKDGTLEPISITTPQEVKLTFDDVTTKKLDYEKHNINPKEALLQEIRSLDEEASTDRVSKYL